MATCTPRVSRSAKLPLVTWLDASTLQLIGVVLPQLQTPLADGLMGHHDPTGAHHPFYVAVTQAEVIIQSDAMSDDLAWKTVIFVAVGGRRRGMSGYLLGCSVGFEKIITGVIMSRVRKDAQQLDNASQGNHQERIDARGITDHGLFVPEERTRAVD